MIGLCEATWPPDDDPDCEPCPETAVARALVDGFVVYVCEHHAEDCDLTPVRAPALFPPA